MMRKLIFVLLVLIAPTTLLAEEPTLPMGLGASTTSEPTLPVGLDSPITTQSSGDTLSEALPFSYSGFIETRIGLRTQQDQTQKDYSIGETRAHLKLDLEDDGYQAQLSGDLVFDPVINDYSVELEQGTGFFDLREANFLLRPNKYLDVKIGRQVLTWGTGDLIFINDMFPKDWNSFFIGRDEEYLKAPSDSIKTSLFTPLVNIDFVYSPNFDPDRFIDGKRVSYFNGNSGTIAGRDNIVYTDNRMDYFHEDEFHLRAYRNIASYETAIYGYHGYWKSPNGYSPTTSNFTFPKLSVVGASIRGSLGDGIGNMEFGYYHSHNDSYGDSPLIRNSEVRFLVGYEQEIGTDLIGSFQYYLEQMQNYNRYSATLPESAAKKDQDRHLLTLRLTKLLMNQNLTLSWFSFFSPSDEDAYMRLKAGYKATDRWYLELGSNLFMDKKQETFFGQFEDNSNIYMAVRYGFVG